MEGNEAEQINGDVPLVPMPECPFDLTILEVTTLPGGDHPAHKCPACGTVYTREHLARLSV